MVFFIDGFSRCMPQRAGRYSEGVNQAIGRSRGGRTTKIHAETVYLYCKAKSPQFDDAPEHESDPQGQRGPRAAAAGAARSEELGSSLDEIQCPADARWTHRANIRDVRFWQSRPLHVPKAIMPLSAKIDPYPGCVEALQHDSHPSLTLNRGSMLRRSLLRDPFCNTS
jgi:hypothetical protein